MSTSHPNKRTEKYTFRSIPNSHSSLFVFSFNIDKLAGLLEVLLCRNLFSNSLYLFSRWSRDSKALKVMYCETWNKIVL